MAPTFEIDTETALAELRDEVVQHRRAGRVHVEFRRLATPEAMPEAVATALVSALSMRPPAAWTRLDDHGALVVATRVLRSDLAYGSPLMSDDRAEALARRFIACFGSGAAFLTNGSLARVETGGTWSSLTDATFDTGVVGVSGRRAGLLWVEDED